jgi:hypothetical protein
MNLFSSECLSVVAIVVAIVSTAISVVSATASVVSARAARRRTIIEEQRRKDEIQRNRVRVDLKETLRQDHYWGQEAQDRTEQPGYPEYLVMKCIIDNPSDSLSLWKGTSMRFVFRDTSDLAHAWTLFCEKYDALHDRRPDQPESIGDSFPYTEYFAEKIHVQLLDTSTGEPVRLDRPIQIEARSKRWLEILIRTSDAWCRELQASKRAIRYLVLRFSFAEQIEEIIVPINNGLFKGSHRGMSQSEINKFVTKWR